VTKNVSTTKLNRTDEYKRTIGIFAANRKSESKWAGGRIQVHEHKTKETIERID
jgi:hypothetical protein